MSMPRVFKILLALAICSTISVAPQAAANSPAGVPCSELDQLNGVLNNEVAAGTGGVRKNIGSPYFFSGDQERDADKNLQTVFNGVIDMQKINAGHPVPGLASLLIALESAADNMKTAVDGIFFPDQDFGGASPRPSTWNSIDNVDQKKDDIAGFLNKLRGNCVP